MNLKKHMKEQQIKKTKKKKQKIKDSEVLSIQSLYSAHGDTHTEVINLN